MAAAPILLELRPTSTPIKVSGIAIETRGRGAGVGCRRHCQGNCFAPKAVQLATPLILIRRPHVVHGSGAGSKAIQNGLRVWVVRHLQIDETEQEDRCNHKN